MINVSYPGYTFFAYTSLHLDFLILVIISIPTLLKFLLFHFFFWPGNWEEKKRFMVVKINLIFYIRACSAPPQVSNSQLTLFVHALLLPAVAVWLLNLHQLQMHICLADLELLVVTVLLLYVATFTICFNFNW